MSKEERIQCDVCKLRPMSTTCSFCGRRICNFCTSEVDGNPSCKNCNQ